MPQSLLTPVVITFNDGNTETWAFDGDAAARTFLEGLSYHPRLKTTELSDDRGTLSFGLDTDDDEVTDRHVAKLAPEAQFEIAIDDPEELSEEHPWGQFDDTAIPLGGTPASLIVPMSAEERSAQEEEDRLAEMTTTLR